MHAHGAEVAGRHDVDESIVIHACGISPTLRPEIPAPVAVQRELVGHAGGFDTGDGADALQYLLQDRATPRPIATIVVVDLDRGSPARLEPQVDVEDPQKAA